MIYKELLNANVGTVKELVSEFGVFTFTKVASSQWLVVLTLKCDSIFPCINFTQTMSSFEASSLFDKYSE